MHAQNSICPQYPTPAQMQQYQYHKQEQVAENLSRSWWKPQNYYGKVLWGTLATWERTLRQECSSGNTHHFPSKLDTLLFFFSCRLSAFLFSMKITFPFSINWCHQLQTSQTDLCTSHINVFQHALWNRLPIQICSTARESVVLHMPKSTWAALDFHTHIRAPFPVRAQALVWLGEELFMYSFKSRTNFSLPLPLQKLFIFWAAQLPALEPENLSTHWGWGRRKEEESLPPQHK